MLNADLNWGPSFLDPLKRVTNLNILGEIKQPLLKEKQIQYLIIARKFIIALLPKSLEWYTVFPPAIVLITILSGWPRSPQ